MDPQSPNAEKRKMPLLIAGMLFIFLVAGIVYVYKDALTKHFIPQPDNSYYVKVGLRAATELYLVHTSGTGSAEPFKKITLENGVEVVPVDAAKGSDGSWYYILADGVDGISIQANIYQENSSGTLRKLTDSSTMKYGLGVSTRGDIVYQAREISSVSELIDETLWDIMILRVEEDSNEQKIAEGTKPSITVDGAAVFYMRHAELHKILLVGAVDTLVSPVTYGYALDKTGNALALINPITQKADVFTISQTHSLNYDRSVLLPSGSTAIAFTQTGLIFANAKKGLEEYRFTLRIVGEDGEELFSKPLILTTQKLPFLIAESLHIYENK